MNIIELNKNDNRTDTLTKDKSDNILFLAAALTKDKSDLRKYTNHIKVENDGNAVATDGARLHYVENLDLKPGFYKVHKALKASTLIEKVAELDHEEYSYPPYEDIIKMPDNGDIQFDKLFDLETVHSVYASLIRHMQLSILNFYFIEDICKRVNEIGTVSIINPKDETEETCQPIRIKLDGKMVVVMPMRA